MDGTSDEHVLTPMHRAQGTQAFPPAVVGS